MAKNRDPVSESSEEETNSSSVSKNAQPVTKKPVPESSEESVEAPVVKPQKQLTPAKRSLPVPGEKEKEILKTPDTKKSKKTEPTEPKKTEPTEKKKILDSAAVAESSKKTLFLRIWSEEDEVVITKGLNKYPEAVTTANCGAFLEFIKEDLHSQEVTKAQLHDKLRRLKKKFKNNRARKVRNFAKPYEKEVYDLSLKVWGDSEDTVVAAAANGNTKGKGKANGSTDNETGAVNGGKVMVAAGMKFGSSGANVEKLLSIGVDMFDGDEEVNGSKEWKKLEDEEMDLTMKHMKVILAKAKLVMDNME